MVIIFLVKGTKQERSYGSASVFTLFGRTGSGHLVVTVLSLHFVFCYGYRLCICSHFFVHYLGDRVKVLGEYC